MIPPPISYAEGMGIGRIRPAFRKRHYATPARPPPIRCRRGRHGANLPLEQADLPLEPARMLPPDTRRGQRARPGQGAGTRLPAGSFIRLAHFAEQPVARSGNVDVRVVRCPDERSGAGADRDTATSSPSRCGRGSGGDRAGRAAGTSVGTPRCPRIRRMTRESSMSAINCSSSPQRGHARTSTPNVRCISSAHT